MKNDVVFAECSKFSMFIPSSPLVIYTNECQLDCRKNLHIYQVDCNFKSFFFIKLQNGKFMEKKRKIGLYV